MADAGVEIQFQATGADNAQRQIALLQSQLNKLSATIASMPKIDLGASVGGEKISFAKDVWKEFHNMFAGLEEELAKITQKLEELSATMQKSASGGVAANTKAIREQTAAMKDLANTNAMLHEVLIGEAPLNVEIQKTRKGVVAATKEAATANKTLASAKNTLGISASNLNRILSMISPTLSGIVFQARALVAALIAAASTPIGAALTAVGAIVAGVVSGLRQAKESFLELNRLNLDGLKKQFENICGRLDEALEKLRRLHEMQDQEKDLKDLGHGADSADDYVNAGKSARRQRETHETNASRTAEELAEMKSARKSLKRKIFETEHDPFNREDGPDSEYRSRGDLTKETQELLKGQDERLKKLDEEIAKNEKRLEQERKLAAQAKEYEPYYYDKAGESRRKEYADAYSEHKSRMEEAASEHKWNTEYNAGDYGKKIEMLAKKLEETNKSAEELKKQADQLAELDLDARKLTEKIEEQTKEAYRLEDQIAQLRKEQEKAQEHERKKLEAEEKKKQNELKKEYSAYQDMNRTGLQAYLQANGGKMDDKVMQMWKNINGRGAVKNPMEDYTKRTAEATERIAEAQEKSNEFSYAKAY